jgi:putative ABC transport system permease protein
MLAVNNVKVALRTLWKHKVPSFINIFGLTIGLSSCLLIAMYIKHQVDFDRFQPNGDRIVRVITEYGFNGNPEIKKGNFTSTKVAPVFVRTFPEVESAVRMTDRDVIVRYEDSFFKEPNFMFADSTFFDLFYYEMLEGNPKTALNGPRKVVLTKSAARKYFGEDESPVGKMLLLKTSEVPYEVTGVLADYPAESQLKFDFIASFSSLQANQEITYFEANYTTYLLLTNSDAVAPLKAKITPFMQKEMAGSGATIDFSLERFSEIHLQSPYAGFVPTVSADFLYILGGVALLILIIVCFTYINLGTARAVDRAREVGVRKVVGAGRIQLFWQFVGESAVLCLVAIIFSVAVVFAVLPWFSDLTQQPLKIESMASLSLGAFCLVVLIFVSLLAGSYPAFVLSRFSPVKVLKGSFKNMAEGKGVQQFLLVFQFSVTLFLIIATFIIRNQLDFIQNHNPGYNRDHVVVLPIDNKVLNDLPAIRNALKSDHHVLNVSRCVSTPVHIVGGYSMRSENMSGDVSIGVNANPVDEEYLPATGLQLIAGTNFTEQDIKDASAEEEEKLLFHYILNESAAKELGWTAEEAVGKKMFLGDHRPGYVRGVVKDFHFESMHQSIKPLVLFTEIRGHGQLLVKVNGSDLQQTVSFIEKTWKQRVPYLPFEYHFLDEDFSSLYRTELQLGSVMNIFSVLAVVLACLGLFGLSSFISQQRTKEMSIRKVLGASFLNIMMLLSTNFLLLFLVSMFIALPFAYMVMDRWLLGFAYRTEISIWLLVASGFLVIAVALLTVSLQALKTAKVNPATTLKSE